MNMFGTAVFNTIVGMGTVFAVLIFISLIISLFVYIPAVEKKIKGLFHPGSKKTSGSESGTKEEEREQEPVEETFVDVPDMDEGERIAVIMGAIAAASANGAVSADKLVVRSIRRVDRKGRR